MNRLSPVCPECGGPMHLAASAYGRSWECDQHQSVASWCPGAIQIVDDEVLTDLQIAEAIARQSTDESDSSPQEQARYRCVSGPLRELTKNPYLSGPEKRVLDEATAIVERMSEAADLAQDQDKLQKRVGRFEQERRYRQAMGFLGPSLAPDPTRLEVSVIDLLALDRFSGEDQFGGYDTIEAFESWLQRRTGGDQESIDTLMRNLASSHQSLRESLAKSWSSHTEPVKYLYAGFSNALPGLRQAILSSPPVFLQGVRRLLAESESTNVVRLSHREPQ